MKWWAEMFGKEKGWWRSYSEWLGQSAPESCSRETGPRTSRLLGLSGQPGGPALSAKKTQGILGNNILI